MKKIISILLCLAILSGLPTFIFAYETEDTAKMEEIITVLTKLDIIDKSASEIDKTALVTRAELVSYVAAMVKLLETKDKRYFNDVSIDHWAFGYINSMAEIGAISIAPDGNFNPDNYVTYEQACKILMAVIGYRGYASSHELSKFVQLAHNLDVGISYDSNAELSYGAVLELLYNTLTVTMAKNDAIDDDDENILGLYHSGYVATGTVDGLYGMETDNVVLEENVVYISGEQFVVSDDVMLEDYFGETVKFIYIENKVDDTKEIIFAKPKYKDRTFEIQSSLITGYDEATGSLDYYVDENSSRTRRIAIPKSANVVFNGKIMQGRLEDNGFIN